MQRGHTHYSKMAGAELASQVIMEMLNGNLELRSGILGLNDQLEIVSSHLSNDRLKMIPLSSSIDEVRRSNGTGIIAFDNSSGNLFISDSNLIGRLKNVCESAGITLIDVMLFGTEDWLSLRRQNRL